MTMCMRRGILVLGFGFALAGTAIAGVEEPIDLAKVPAKIMEIAKENFKGLKVADVSEVRLDDETVDDDSIIVSYQDLGEVKIVSANTETETDGTFVYEIQGVFADGRRVEIDIEPDGTVLEIEKEFRIEDVPGAVLKAIEAKMPGFKPEFIEAAHSPGSLQVVRYELVGMLGETKMDIEISADGSTIVVADQ